MGSIQSILFILLPIIGSVMLVYGIFQLIGDLRTNKSKRVVDRLKEGSGTKADSKVKDSIVRQKASDLQHSLLESVVSQLQFVPKLQRVLDQADINWSASKLLVNLALISIALTVVMKIVGFGILSCLSVGGGALLLPIWFCNFKRKRRIRKIMEQLPDVFDLMGQALKAGHSLASAIQLVSEQLPDPVAKEFAQVFYEQNLGIKIEEALTNMANRVDQMDVRFFVTAVLIQRQTGGDLGEVLDKISKVIRDRIQLFGVVQALTAEGRLSGWVLLLLPVVVFFASMVMNPEYAAELTSTKSGNFMLAAAVIMDMLGLALIKKIVNIKV